MDSSAMKVVAVQEVEEPDSKRESQTPSRAGHEVANASGTIDEEMRTYTEEESRELINEWNRHAIHKIELNKKPPSEHKQQESDYGPISSAPDKSEGDGSQHGCQEQISEFFEKSHKY